MNAFEAMRLRCGLTQQEAADYLKVRLDTVKSWSSGRRTPGGPRIVGELGELSRRIAEEGERLHEDIVALLPTPNDVVEVTLAEGRRGDMPWGARVMAIADAIARLHEPPGAGGVDVEIVERKTAREPVVRRHRQEAGNVSASAAGR